MSSIKKFAKKKMAELGKTQKEIVSTLKRYKVKGDCGNTRSCALAVYFNDKINKAFGIKLAVNVSSDRLEVGTHFPKDYGPPENSIEIPLNKQCKKFIDNFDNEKYPELCVKN